MAQEEYLAFCKKVLPLPTELRTCRTCPVLADCLKHHAPDERCPLMVLGASVINDKEE